MRKMKLEVWCDYCWADGEQLTEAARTFAVGALETSSSFPGVKMIETCETHSKTITDLITLLGACAPFKADQAAPTKAPALFAAGPPSSTRRQPCPVCGHDLHGSAIIAHVWSHHADVERPDSPSVCPECRARYDTAQGCSVHRRLVHGHDALGEALMHVPGHPTYRRAIER